MSRRDAKDDHSAGSVAELVRRSSDDASFVSDFEQHVARRRIIHSLFGLRSARNVSQNDLAKTLDCSQSRVSKLENSEDDDLRLGDLRGYAEALGLDVRLVLSRHKASAVDEIKYHAFCIKRWLERLGDLAAKDEVIAKAVAGFYGEAFFNLVKILSESAQKLPPKPDGTSRYIEIEMMSVEVEDQPKPALAQPNSCEPAST